MPKAIALLLWDGRGAIANSSDYDFRRLRQIAWSPKSLRAFKRMVRQNPQLRPLIETTLFPLIWGVSKTITLARLEVEEARSASNDAFAQVSKNC